MLWRWTKTAFSRQLSERFRKSGKQHSRSFAKKPIHEAWGRLKRSRSCKRFFVDILLEQADLYSLVFFLDTQTFYQVLFAQVYSVRLTPIYLFLSIGQFCKYDKDSCIKSEKFLSQHLHISIFRLVINH